MVKKVFFVKVVHVEELNYSKVPLYNASFFIFSEIANASAYPLSGYAITSL